MGNDIIEIGDTVMLLITLAGGSKDYPPKGHIGKIIGTNFGSICLEGYLKGLISIAHINNASWFKLIKKGNEMTKAKIKVGDTVRYNGKFQFHKDTGIPIGAKGKLIRDLYGHPHLEGYKYTFLEDGENLQCVFDLVESPNEYFKAGDWVECIYDFSNTSNKNIYPPVGFIGKLIKVENHWNNDSVVFEQYSQAIYCRFNLIVKNNVYFKPITESQLIEHLNKEVSELKKSHDRLKAAYEKDQYDNCRFYRDESNIPVETKVHELLIDKQTKQVREVYGIRQCGMYVSTLPKNWNDILRDFNRNRRYNHYINGYLKKSITDKNELYNTYYDIKPLSSYTRVDGKPIKISY